MFDKNWREKQRGLLGALQMPVVDKQKVQQILAQTKGVFEDVKPDLETNGLIVKKIAGNTAEELKRAGRKIVTAVQSL